ncbi:MAG: LysR family transcriptional regulator [Betaproteobacteria bacterium]|nr:LysR family transcriptional regulator [Betaproteobacteria bacterium]MBI3937440.1 LysR family transcriptional regulator [Betaproteobacteria bacterium]
MRSRFSPTVTLRALKVFFAVSVTGSMSAAARKLGITQSAVSQIVRLAEEEFGAVLVDRAARPLRLTAAGTVLQRHAARVIEDAEALVTLVRQAGSEKIPELRIGIIDSFASTVGPSLIRALLKDATRITFLSGLAHDQAEGLLSRNLDLIITSDALDDIDGLERHPVLTEPFVVLLPEKLGRTGAATDLKALAVSYPLVRFSARSQIGNQIERHLRRLGLRAPQVVEVDATDALVALVRAGVGWAIATPLCLLQVRSQYYGIKAVPFSDTPFNRQIFLIARSGEFGSLPGQIARTSCRILAAECLDAMVQFVPWTRGQFIIGHPAPAAKGSR